jgi:hypothetical protein
MRHLLAILLTAVLALGTAVPIQAQEPDRIISTLTVAGVSPLDQPVYVTTGTVDVVVDTTLLCTPPEDKVGCGVIVAATLHAPVTDPSDPQTTTLYPDVVDVVSSVPCGDGYAPGCQAGTGDSQFVYQFPAPRAGTYVLEVWTVVGMDYPSPDVRLDTNYLSTHDGSVYPNGVVYVVKGFTVLIVEEVYAA